MNKADTVHKTYLLPSSLNEYLWDDKLFECFHESTRNAFSCHLTSVHKLLSDQTSNQLQEEIPAANIQVSTSIA